MITKEIWKDVVGYKGSYKISSYGNVFSCHINRNLTPALDKDGYPMVNLCLSGKYKSVRIHRLVAAAFLPNENNLPIVDHKNGNKADNFYLNLRWCNNQQNLSYDNRKRNKGGNNKSGFKGVYWHNIKKKWVAMHYEGGIRNTRSDTPNTARGWFKR